MGLSGKDRPCTSSGSRSSLPCWQVPDVKFTQSTDGGSSWSTPATVNDNVDAAGVPTDQFQPSVAAGPGGAVAVAFYDRRLPCPNDPSILPADIGRTNFCIDVSLQAYKDSGNG